MEKKTEEKEEKKMVVKTPSVKIWEEIKDKELDMFSLPGQTVEKYCKVVNVEPSKLYVTTSVQAVVPALESAIGSKFDIEMATKYIIISYKKE